MAKSRVIAERYELRDRIGGGGMGRVWLAYDRLLCRDVAIKEVAPHQGLSDELAELAFHEAQAAAQVDHPNVVRVYDIVQSGHWPWIVMQYVPSQSLKALVGTVGPLGVEDVARIGLCLVDALSAIHRAGVLHRDVTPHNVLMGNDGHVMLTDFGLAVWPALADPAETQLRGTAQYVAPERVITGRSTPAGDLWSLGATLYMAVEGYSPFGRPTVAATLSALVADPPDPPSRAGELTAVLLGLIEREPRLRLTASEARAMLQRIANGAPRLTSAVAD